MKINKLIVLVAGVLTFASCSPSQEELNQNIEKAEIAYREAGNLGKDAGECKALLDLYEEMIKYYPEESDSIRFKAGEIYMNRQVIDKAIEHLSYLFENKPDFEDMEHVILYLGFINNNNLYDTDEAKKYYDLFLERYPESIYAKDVKASLRFLGKTPDEILEILTTENDSSNGKLVMMCVDSIYSK